MRSIAIIVLLACLLTIGETNGQSTDRLPLRATVQTACKALNERILQSNVEHSRVDTGVLMQLEAPLVDGLLTLVEKSLPESEFQRLSVQRAADVTVLLTNRIPGLVSQVPGCCFEKWEVGARLEAIRLELTIFRNVYDFTARIEKNGEAGSAVDHQSLRFADRVIELLGLHPKAGKGSVTSLALIKAAIHSGLRLESKRSTSPVFKVPIPDVEFEELLSKMTLGESEFPSLNEDSFKLIESTPALAGPISAHWIANPMFQYRELSTTTAMSSVFKGIPEHRGVTDDELENVNKLLMKSFENERGRHEEHLAKMKDQFAAKAIVQREKLDAQSGARNIQAPIARSTRMWMFVANVCLVFTLLFVSWKSKVRQSSGNVP